MRCYNGAPDSELQLIWDKRDKLHEELHKRGLKSCYFPLEDKWSVSTSIFSNQSFKQYGIFSHSFEAVAQSAIRDYDEEHQL